MSPKDQQIIKAYPDATPYDLQMKYGLSPAGFNELIANADKETSNILKAGTPRLTANINVAVPKITVMQPHNTQDEQVTLRGKKGNGNGSLLSRVVAEKLVKKYPNSYEII